MRAPWPLAAVSLALGLALAMPAAAQPADLFERVADLRDRGHDAAAVRLLEAADRDAPSARVTAELGLAYQGADRPADAERRLGAALEAAGDTWIEEHRAALELALGYARASLGWVTVSCDTMGAEVRVVGDGPAVACGEALRIEVGGRAVEVTAPFHRSVRRHVDVGQGERVTVEVSLEPHDCPSYGMQHIGGADGGCCWPGQTWSEGQCVGGPECPDGGWAYGGDCMSADTPRHPPARLASFHVTALGGVASFARTDTSLFRPGVGAQAEGISLGPRLELRFGIKLFDLLGLDLTVGGAMQGSDRWLDCPPGAAGCARRSATAYTLDFGLMLSAHTDPPRRGGNVDFHVGVGARPWVNLLLDDDADGGRLTATVVPAELGASIFFADVISLDLIGQSELWLPWEYCGHGADGASYCLGTDDLDYELAWSGLAGLTLHVD